MYSHIQYPNIQIVTLMLCFQLSLYKRMSLETSRQKNDKN